MHKLLSIILLGFTLSLSYQGSTHKQIALNMPGIFGLSILQTFPDIHILAEGSSSPDADYPNMKIPNEYLPEVLRPYNTSVVKWEHAIPDDVLEEIENILKKPAKKFYTKISNMPMKRL